MNKEKVAAVLESGGAIFLEAESLCQVLGENRLGFSYRNFTLLHDALGQIIGCLQGEDRTATLLSRTSLQTRVERWLQDYSGRDIVVGPVQECFDGARNFLGLSVEIPKQHAEERS